MTRDHDFIFVRLIVFASLTVILVVIVGISVISGTVAVIFLGPGGFAGGCLGGGVRGCIDVNIWKLG